MGKEEKIHIDSVSDVKIYKAKPWAIYFKCKNQKYLLHYDTDYDNLTTLYKKDTDENGRYKLTFVCNRYGNYISNLMPEKPPTATYKSIRKQFVWSLCFHGFAEGVFEDEIEAAKGFITFYEMKIKIKEREIRELKAKIEKEKECPGLIRIRRP